MKTGFELESIFYINAERHYQLISYFHLPKRLFYKSSNNKKSVVTNFGLLML